MQHFSKTVLFQPNPQNVRDPGSSLYGFFNNYFDFESFTFNFKSMSQRVATQSFRYSPCNIDVIEWLGANYIETQFCEKAIQYFERATLIQ